MKNYTRKVFPLFIAFLFPFFSLAQETPPHVVDAPIDAWLVALLGAGAVYGAIRMNKEAGR